MRNLVLWARSVPALEELPVNRYNNFGVLEYWSIGIVQCERKVTYKNQL
jgi:hypothetical protein